MKKAYEAPTVEKIAFQYRDQVVAASGTHTNCELVWVNTSSVTGTECESDNKLQSWNN